jgi:hypothetical protein
MSITDQNAVFVTICDEQGRVSKHRVSKWMTWTEAIEMWTAMDDQRREALVGRKVLVHKGATIRHYEVRGVSDPGYNMLPVLDLAKGFAVLSQAYTTMQGAAKAVLKPLGYEGRAGGWIYSSSVQTRRPLIQGWVSAAKATRHPVVRLAGEKGYRGTVTTMLQVAKSEG